MLALRIHILHFFCLYDCSFPTHHHWEMPSKRESLIGAASKGQLEVFKSLLQPDQSSSLQVANITLEKLAAIAASQYHARLLKFCVGLGASVNNDAVRSGALKSSSLNVYKAIVPAGFDLNYEHDGTIGGPLIWATFRNDIRLAAYLLEHGADVNRDLQSRIYRPLAKAAQRNSVELIKLFIKHGAGIDHSGALIVSLIFGADFPNLNCLINRVFNLEEIILTSKYAGGCGAWESRGRSVLGLVRCQDRLDTHGRYQVVHKYQ